MQRRHRRQNVRHLLPQLQRWLTLQAQDRDTGGAHVCRQLVVDAPYHRRRGADAFQQGKSVGRLIRWIQQTVQRSIQRGHDDRDRLEHYGLPFGLYQRTVDTCAESLRYTTWKARSAEG